MITRIVKMYFVEEKKDDFLSLFEDVKDKVRNQAGCNYLELLRDAHDPATMITYSIWNSEEDLNNYRKSEFFGITWKKTKALFRDKPEAISLESLEKII